MDEMDVLELLGALHNALQPGASVEDTESWKEAFAVIRREVEADAATDKYDRETLDVIDAKLKTLIGELESGNPEPDFKPARTWVAALGAAIHRRRA
ncbi:hypothetical protein K32_18480 [Kaistia sp. 32K]|uniref:hypothetical protein n=1 Tax=Kaistia sp. 32K TaxID=2795690 RepID=UPI001915C19F|nr:hypothetical protein [Kaistia sp. 32K]BCP53231.1 hypothetical protein K32_18480 [Kaistia sp. 32K]